MADPTERITAGLDAIALEDDQHPAEGPSAPTTIDSNVDFNFEERNAFETRWAEELVLIQRMREMLVTGERHLNTLYTYRSCSMCLPAVKSQDQANKGGIYEGTCLVLEPEVRKLKDFLAFHVDCVKFFGDTLRRLARNKEFSEVMTLYLVRMLDLLAQLDALKNMKACLNNDFAAYKRAAGFARKNTGQDDQTQENHVLYLFLANQNAISLRLRDELKECEGSEDVLIQVALTCATALESGRYMLPGEKHCLLRVMPYALYLLDGEDSKHNIFKHKSINLSQFGKIFKKNPIVSVYGDMQMPLDQFVKQTTHFEEKAWLAFAPDAQIAIEYEIVHHIATFREAHNEYLGRLTQLVAEVRIARAEIQQGQPQITPALQAMSHDVLNVLLQGIQLLSDWTSRILQQAAWKYSRPNLDENIKAEVDYERVVRYNYKPAERSALIELIALTKGLGRVILKHEPLLAPLVRVAVHDEIQDFIQVGMREVLAFTGKKKLKIRTDVMQLRTMLADWLDGTEPLDTAIPAKKTVQRQQFPLRQVGTSVIQHELMRDTVFGLLLSKETKKELSSSHIKLLEDFYARSYYYPYALDLAGSVAKSTDLADLWYREFYLELTKRMQFPIEMSLPWILADHVLENKEGGSSDLVEYVLYPFDIYNDAANRALRSLRQRFLYEEIEAELNLCFDQLLYKLSEQVYTNFKAQASAILFDKPYRAQLEALGAIEKEKLHVPRSRYDSILSQRHVELLGRTVDLNLLISQRINTYLHQNVDAAISRFEASDLTTVLELDAALANVKLTYELLKKHLQLDPWESIVTQGTEATSLASFHNRVLLHTLFELTFDVLPRFNYNATTQRFMRATVQFGEDPPREPMPRQNPMFAFGNRHIMAVSVAVQDMQRKFLGLPHMLALARLIGRTHLPMLLGELMRSLYLKIGNVLAPYVAALIAALPPSSKLPLHEYGVEGSYGMFSMKLRELVEYGDLKPEVLQNFREVGNALAFVQLLDQVLRQSDLAVYVQAAPALGLSPDTLAAGTHGADPSASSPLYTVAASLAAALASHPGLRGTPDSIKDVAVNAWRADKFYRPPEQNMSLLRMVLGQMNQMLDTVRAEWTGAAHSPDNGIMDVEGPYEFYRLWCALEFIMCMPQKHEEKQYLELFGDGIVWAGCAFTHLLNQRQRFSAFNFCYHTLNISEAADKQSASPDIAAFLRNAMYMRDLSGSIFAALDTYYPLAAPSNESLALHPPESLQLKPQFEGASSSASSFGAPAGVPPPSASPVSAVAPPSAPMPPPAPRAPVAMPAAPPAPPAPAARGPSPGAPPPVVRPAAATPVGGAISLTAEVFQGSEDSDKKDKDKDKDKKKSEHKHKHRDKTLRGEDDKSERRSHRDKDREGKTPRTGGDDSVTPPPPAGKPEEFAPPPAPRPVPREPAGAAPPPPPAVAPPPPAEEEEEDDEPEYFDEKGTQFWYDDNGDPYFVDQSGNSQYYDTPPKVVTKRP